MVPARSRQITSAPGCSRSQSVRLSAVRSGRRSTGRWVRMSSKIVPYRRPRRSEKSSTPSTVTVPIGGSGTARTRRNNVSRPAGRIPDLVISQGFRGLVRDMWVFVVACP
jgi:hypothetical protein